MAKTLPGMVGATPTVSTALADASHSSATSNMTEDLTASRSWIRSSDCWAISVTFGGVKVVMHIAGRMHRHGITISGDAPVRRMRFQLHISDR